MFTVLEARALGLPVYVQCTACMAPSRPIPLFALDRSMDLETAARAGRFRCKACGGKTGELMASLHSLIADRKRLRLECQPCGKDQALSAAQACVLFGLATPFDDLRRRLQCREGCRLRVASMGAGEVLSGSAKDIMTLPAGTV